MTSHPAAPFLRPLLRLLLLAGLFLFVLATAAPGASPVRPSPAEPLGPRPYAVLGLEAEPRLWKSVDDTAHQAFRRTQENAPGLAWSGTLEIRWCASDAEFLRRTGNRPEYFAAAVSPALRTIWINAGAWRRSGERERVETLAHEMAHVLIHTANGGRHLPLWAEEGLAMHIAGQWGGMPALELAEAGFFGALPRLAEMEHSFPDRGPTVAMAYAVSAQAISRLAAGMGDRPGRVVRLLSLLDDPIQGPRFAASLFDPVEREGVQGDVNAMRGSMLLSLGVTAVGGAIFWLLVAVLLVVAWFKMKARAREIARREEEDEPWRQSLTEADVQDIYGDREGRWDVPEDAPKSARRAVPWPEAEDR